MTRNGISVQLGLAFVLSAFSSITASARDPWVTYEGKDGPGRGKHIVLVSGDDEYRSEEGMPMLARILAVRHGFRCTVLFAIDPKDGSIKPDYQKNIPGTHLLEDADLMVLFLRFRNLPDEQMKYIVDFVNSGRPVIGLRTSTHAFNYEEGSSSRYAKYSWRSENPRGGFGQLVFGDTWVNHHGKHGKESTRGIVNPRYASHPVVRGVDDIWGPSDVYGIIHLPDDAQVLVHGQVLAGMRPDSPPVEGSKNDPMMPLAWVRTYEGDTGNTTRIFCTTMGASQDLQSEGLRRLMVNACYWGLKMEEQMPAQANVQYAGPYEPTPFGFGTYQQGLRPEDFAP